MEKAVFDGHGIEFPSQGIEGDSRLEAQDTKSKISLDELAEKLKDVLFQKPDESSLQKQEVTSESDAEEEQPLFVELEDGTTVELPRAQGAEERAADVDDRTLVAVDRDEEESGTSRNDAAAESGKKDLSSLISRMTEEYSDPIDPESDRLDMQELAEERVQRVEKKIEEIESNEPPLKASEISEIMDGEKITYATDDNGKVAGFRVGNISENSVNEYRIPGTTYSMNGFTYYTDAQGRVERVEGMPHMESEDSTRNQVDQRTSGGMSRAYGDDGGHLAAKRLGGAASWLNIVPMDAGLNRGDYKKMESSVAQMMENSEAPRIRVDVRYEDPHGTRPTGFVYTVETSERKIQRVFDNV